MYLQKWDCRRIFLHAEMAEEEVAQQRGEKFTYVPTYLPDTPYLRKWRIVRQGCGSGSGPFGWIRTIFTGSVFGSYRHFGYVKLYKQGKNILKIELLHIFR